MKKHYTEAFKTKLVLELLKEEKTLSQLASEHQVHPNQLRQKNQAADLIATHEQPASFRPIGDNIENMLKFFSEVDRAGLIFCWEPRYEQHILPYMRLGDEIITVEDYWKYMLPEKMPMPETSG